MGIINKSIVQEKHNFGALFFAKTFKNYLPRYGAVSADKKLIRFCFYFFWKIGLEMSNAILREI